MNIGTFIDNLYEARAKRLALDKEVTAAKIVENEAKEALIAQLNEMGLTKASGTFATVGIKTTAVPHITDWDAVHKFIRENDRFDLIQKRIGVVAWRDMYEAKVLVPGTECAFEVDLSLTKAKR